MSYQPKTGAKCYCKRGIQRDNCPNCEGTGWVINFAAIRAKTITKLAPLTPEQILAMDKAQAEINNQILNN